MFGTFLEIAGMVSAMIIVAGTLLAAILFVMTIRGIDE